MVTRFTFLGTGGGRFTTIFQARATGGLYIEDRVRIHVDPGPGSLIRMRALRIDPTRTDMLLISHSHPDHYTDAEIIIEGITGGGIKKRGQLFAARSVLEGVDDGKYGIGPAISKYHQGLLPSKSVEPGDFFSIDNIDIEATPSVHSDPATVGFKFHTRNGVISYVADTEAAEHVMDAHRGSRVLILPITRPRGSRIPGHLCTEDALRFIDEIGPEMVFFNHFGLKMVRAPPKTEAEWVQKKTGIRTVAAQDGMRVSVGTRITVR